MPSIFKGFNEKKSDYSAKTNYKEFHTQLSADYNKQSKVEQIFPKKLNPAMISRL